MNVQPKIRRRKIDSKTLRATNFIIAYMKMYGKEPTQSEVKQEIGKCGRAVLDSAFRDAKLVGEIKISKAQINHIEAIINIYRKQLEFDYNNRINEEIERRHEVAFPRWRQEYESAHKLQQNLYKVIDEYKPVFTEIEYSNIFRCLHPDSRLSISEELLKQAFQTFTARKIRLLTPKKATD